MTSWEGLKFESAFLEQNVGFSREFQNWWKIQVVQNRGAIGKIGYDKRGIQSEKSMTRSNILIEVTVDCPNGLSSFRTDRLNMRRTW